MISIVNTECHVPKTFSDLAKIAAWGRLGLFLPLIGPTTVRDLVGLGIDRMVLPSVFGQPFNQPTYTIPASIVGSLDYRVEFDTQLRKMKETPDPYAASRKNYLESRQAEIDALHGRRLEQPVLRRTLPVFP